MSIYEKSVKYGPPLIEQGTSSLINFSVGLLLFSMLTVEEFSSYSVIFTCIVFAQYIQQVAIIEPGFRLREKKNDKSETITLIALVESIAISSILACIASVITGVSLGVLAIYFLIQSVYYMFRRFILYYSNVSIVSLINLFIILLLFIQFNNYSRNISLDSALRIVSIAFFVPIGLMSVYFLHFSKKHKQNRVHYRGYLPILWRIQTQILPFSFLAWLQTNIVILILHFEERHELNAEFRFVLLFSLPAMQIISQLVQVKLKNTDSFNVTTSSMIKLLVNVMSISILSVIFCVMLAQFGLIGNLSGIKNLYLIFIAMLIYPIGMSLFSFISVNLKINLNYLSLTKAHFFGLTSVLIFGSVALYWDLLNTLIIALILSGSYLISSFYLVKN